MSLTKRIIDLAKSNLNAILERAAETADPRRKLASIPDAELEAELARRRAARVAEEKVAAARARVDAGSSSQVKMPADRAERERQAKEREARVRAAREAREKASRENAERAWRAQRPPSSGGGPGAGPRPGAGARRPFTRAPDPDLKRYYDRLELPYGADFEAVKGSYRKLMRRYHPDLHGNKSAEKQRAATEVAQALTQAYNELEKHLMGGPNRR
jgi:hypothetical protein